MDIKTVITTRDTAISESARIGVMDDGTAKKRVFVWVGRNDDTEDDERVIVLKLRKENIMKTKLIKLTATECEKLPYPETAKRLGGLLVIDHSDGDNLLKIETIRRLFYDCITWN